MDNATLQSLTVEDLLRAIHMGKADDQLSQVERALKSRQRVKAIAYHRGQKFKLNNTVRPLYLIGVTGTIVKVNQKRCVVNFDEGQYLGRYPQYGVTVPFDMIEPA